MMNAVIAVLGVLAGAAIGMSAMALCATMKGNDKALIDMRERRPPAAVDIDRSPVPVGGVVIGVYDGHLRRFRVDGLRLRSRGGRLRWVVLSEEDGRWTECPVSDCKVIRQAP